MCLRWAKLPIPANGHWMESRCQPCFSSLFEHNASFFPPTCIHSERFGGVNKIFFLLPSSWPADWLLSNSSPANLRHNMGQWWKDKERIVEYPSQPKRLPAVPIVAQGHVAQMHTYAPSRQASLTSERSSRPLL